MHFHKREDFVRNYDLENNGLGKACVLLKADQEPAIVYVQKAIQDLKPEIVPINSPVGESASMGCVTLLEQLG